MAVPYQSGFESLEDELVEQSLPVEGTIPDWLSGSLIRNGPGKFDIDGEPIAHWFDGLAMLRKFTISGREETIEYTNRFLQSQAYRDALQGGKPPGFGTGSGGLLQKIIALLTTATDNTNANVARRGDRFEALTETPDRIAFDPVTLETLGTIEYDDDLSGHLTTPHPQYDAARGESINFLTEFSLQSSYHVYRLPDDEPTRECISSIDVDEPAYMHSCGLTENYVILPEFPFVIHPLSLLRPKNRNKGFIEHFEWKPEQGTRFIIIDRWTGEVIAEPRTEGFLAFHHPNMFERGSATSEGKAEAEEIVFDTVAFDDPSALDALYLNDLRSQSADAQPTGELRRYRLPLDESGLGSTAVKTIYTEGISLPRIADGYARRDYRYVYGTANQRIPAVERPNRLVKVDVRTGSTQTYTAQHLYFGEPVFVPYPGDDVEDEGVVLSVALDTQIDCSLLLLLDGATFDEIARAKLPHHLPFDFHGQFFPYVDR